VAGTGPLVRAQVAVYFISVGNSSSGGDFVFFEHFFALLETRWSLRFAPVVEFSYLRAALPLPFSAIHAPHFPTRPS
jgi:hypothetical protein